MANDYFNTMLSRRVRTDGFIDPCIPTLAAKAPSGPDWVHEIKHDGYGGYSRAAATTGHTAIPRSPPAPQCCGRGHSPWMARR